MTTAWRCAPCQRMRQIQITQWSGARACNLLAKIEFRCGWLRWREWCVAWMLRGRSRGRYASTRQSGSIRQLSLQSKFLPSFRERYSPPNPESASIGRNLGWRNYSCCPVMDVKNMTTNLLWISSKYGVDTAWNMADHTGNITAQVSRAFEPENMSITWTIEYWQLMASILTAGHQDQNGHSQNVSGKHYGKPRRYIPLFLKMKILYFHMLHHISQCRCGLLMMRYLNKVRVISPLIPHSIMTQHLNIHLVPPIEMFISSLCCRRSFWVISPSSLN